MLSSLNRIREILYLTFMHLVYYDYQTDMCNKRERKEAYSVLVGQYPD